eukprot:364426-Chlamydomonas_euryale.AAC.8
MHVACNDLQKSAGLRSPHLVTPALCRIDAPRGSDVRRTTPPAGDTGDDVMVGRNPLLGLLPVPTILVLVGAGPPVELDMRCCNVGGAFRVVRWQRLEGAAGKRQYQCRKSGRGHVGLSSACRQLRACMQAGMTPPPSDHSVQARSARSTAMSSPEIQHSPAAQAAQPPCLVRRARTQLLRTPPPACERVQQRTGMYSALPLHHMPARIRGSALVPSSGRPDPRPALCSPFPPPAAAAHPQNAHVDSSAA